MREKPQTYPQKAARKRKEYKNNKRKKLKGNKKA